MAEPNKNAAEFNTMLTNLAGGQFDGDDIVRDMPERPAGWPANLPEPVMNAGGNEIAMVLDENNQKYLLFHDPENAGQFIAMTPQEAVEMYEGELSKPSQVRWKEEYSSKLSGHYGEDRARLEEQLAPVKAELQAYSDQVKAYSADLRAHVVEVRNDAGSLIGHNRVVPETVVLKNDIEASPLIRIDEYGNAPEQIAKVERAPRRVVEPAQAVAEESQVGLITEAPAEEAPKVAADSGWGLAPPNVDEERTKELAGGSQPEVVEKTAPVDNGWNIAPPNVDEDRVAEIEAHKPPEPDIKAQPADTDFFVHRQEFANKIQLGGAERLLQNGVNTFKTLSAAGERGLEMELEHVGKTMDADELAEYEDNARAKFLADRYEDLAGAIQAADEILSVNPNFAAVISGDYQDPSSIKIDLDKLPQEYESVRDDLQAVQDLLNQMPEALKSDYTSMSPN